jgi:hypothetical protein
MKKNKTPQAAFPDRDDKVEDLWSHMAKTADLATTIAAAAHGSGDFNDTGKCLDVIRTSAEIVADRICYAIEELETIWKVPTKKE